MRVKWRLVSIKYAFSKNKIVVVCDGAGARIRTLALPTTPDLISDSLPCIRTHTYNPSPGEAEAREVWPVGTFYKISVPC